VEQGDFGGQYKTGMSSRGAGALRDLREVSICVRPNDGRGLPWLSLYSELGQSLWKYAHIAM
jgi:hypothetical protein